MKFFRKALAAREDLLWGKAKVAQLRGANSVEVTPFNLIHGVSSIDELKALDTSKYFYAMLYVSPDLFFYCFDATETSPADDITYFAPNTGAGRWVKKTLS